MELNRIAGRHKLSLSKVFAISLSHFGANRMVSFRFVSLLWNRDNLIDLAYLLLLLLFRNWIIYHSDAKAEVGMQDIGQWWWWWWWWWNSSVVAWINQIKMEKYIGKYKQLSFSPFLRLPSKQQRPSGILKESRARAINVSQDKIFAI